MTIDDARSAAGNIIIARAARSPVGLPINNYEMDERKRIVTGASQRI